MKLLRSLFISGILAIVVWGIFAILIWLYLYRLTHPQFFYYIDNDYFGIIFLILASLLGLAILFLSIKYYINSHNYFQSLLISLVYSIFTLFLAYLLEDIYDLFSILIVAQAILVLGITLFLNIIILGFRTLRRN